MKRDLAFVYLGFVSRYAGSFISLPFLARVLEPAGLGSLVMAISVANLIALCVEFGFGVSALRDVSACTSDAQRRTVLDGVLFARGLLAVIVAVIFAVTSWGFPGQLPTGSTSSLVVGMGAIQGMSLAWYLQGTRRAPLAAGLDAATQFGWIIAALICVSGPEHVSRVLSCQVAAQALNLLITLRIARPGWQGPSVDWRQIAQQLKAGVPLFVMRAGVALFTTASVFMLGYLAGATEAGYYNAAERFAGTLIAAFIPASQTLMPWLVRVRGEAGDNAMLGSARRVLIVLFSLGVLATLAFLLCAPLIIKLIVGPQYELSITVLRVLALAFPFAALTQAVGVNVMVPLRLDRAFTVAILMAGITCVSSAWLLIPAHGALGLAVGRVLAEAVIALVCAVVLARQGVLRELLGLRGRR